MEKYNINKLGKRIAMVRSNSGMTQKELAKKLGSSNWYLSTLERGLRVPSVNYCVKIAYVLKIPLHELFIEKKSSMVNSSIREEIDAILTKTSQKEAKKILKLIKISLSK